MWKQKEIRLKAKSRGFHLVTEEVLAQLPELKAFHVGLDECADKTHFSITDSE